ncbi:MAG: hypothetical protein AB7L71_09190, partial [Vicinamibacterales bacterium]
VRLYADGQPAGRVELTWDPARVGSYLVPMPVSLRDSVDLELFVESGAAEPRGLRFWYAQVRVK